MEMEKLVLVTNPGSSSRKYALYKGESCIAQLHFEYENNVVICTIVDPETGRKTIKCDFKDLSSTVANLRKILGNEGYITEQYPLDAIVARIVAPADFFMSDHIVDDEFMTQFEAARARAPIHIPVIASEISHFRSSFKTTPILGISDSSFQWNKPDLMKYYPFDLEIADKYQIKRYGYHGLSVGSIVHTMRQAEILPEKLIVCHIGSGSSVSAVYNGEALDTSMGYSPLEGVMMATRSGSIDVSAALALKKALGLSDDGLEKYLNKKSGLLGVGGSDDMREIILHRDEGDSKATFAHALYMYRIQSLIGQMAASLGGVDAIVFTATILERNAEVRNFIAQKLSYLGFAVNSDLNNSVPIDAEVYNIATDQSKPIYVIKTDETSEMLRHAYALLDTTN